MHLAGPAHSLEASPAGGPGGGRASYPLWGWVASAPAARPLANSDYFFFSLLSWVPLFLTVHFLWAQD